MADRPIPKIALARQMRKAMTEPECLLWSRLKLRDNGPVFKRQKPVGPYILDFFCHAAQLAIEIDGYTHSTEESHACDQIRDAYFAKLGIETYRVSAPEVYRDVDGVADGIKLRANDRIATKST